MEILRPIGLQWVERVGIAAWDFLIGSFTFDDALHSLDISSIVPANAKLVSLCLQGSAAAGGRSFSVGSPAATTNYDLTGIITPGAGISSQCNVIVPVDDTQTIKYAGSAAGFNDAEIIVLGWGK